MQKKTLDDYYYKLKSASSFGFDFDKHKNEKIGLLRQFVKDYKKKVSKKTSAPQFNVGTGGHGGTSVHGINGMMGASYASSYPSSQPQKPPEDEIDKYFAKENVE